MKLQMAVYFFFSPINIHPSNSYPIAVIIFFWSNMKPYEA